MKTRIYLLALDLVAAPVYAALVADVETAIKGSDDFVENKAIFVKATSSLVNRNTCSIAELKDLNQ